LISGTVIIILIHFKNSELDNRSLTSLADDCLDTSVCIKNELCELLDHFKQKHPEADASFTVVINQMDPASSGTAMRPCSASIDNLDSKESSIEDVAIAVQSANQMLRGTHPCQDHWTAVRNSPSKILCDAIESSIATYPDEVVFYLLENMITHYKRIQIYLAKLLQN
jgi:hypothetical protein